MRSKQKKISAKAYKILSLVLAFTVLMSGLGVWYISGTSNTVEAATALNDPIYNANAEFYDYYYDNQITGTSSNINQGLEKQPYTYFNSLISDYAGGAQISSDPSTFRLDLNSISTNVSGTVGFYVYYNITVKDLEGVDAFDTNKITFVQMSDDDNDGIWEATLSQNDVDSIQAKCGSGTFVIRFWVESWNEYIRIASDSVVKAFCATGYTYNFERPSGWKDNWLNATQNKKTVQSENSLTMPLYFGQFWIDSEGDNTYNATSAASWGLNKFVWGANLAFRPAGTGTSTTDQGKTNTPQYYAAAQGIVDNTLSNGVPQQGGVNLPYFDKTWLTETKYNNKSIANVISDLKFPFYRNDNVNTTIAGQSLSGNYYVFDSSKDSVYIDDSGKLTSNSGTVNDKEDKPGFFPFNDTSANSDKTKLNYGFGSKFEITFNLTEDGTLEGNDMIFAFKGDDDVWVFIDGHLVLDMGGAHKEAEGIINFKTGQVIVENASSALTNTIKGSKENLNITTVTESGKLDFLKTEGKYDTSPHTLTMYYMERGMINSNLYVQFNMAVVPNENTLTVENVVNADDVNPGLRDQTYAVADNDVFEYTLANKGTDKDDVDSTGVQYPEYDYIKRFNENFVALLSGQNGRETTREVVDTECVYLSAISSWTDNAYMAAWVWKEGQGNSHVKVLESVTINSTKYYKMSYDESEYDRIIFVRAKSQPTEDSKNFPDSYNQTDTITVTVSSLSNENIYKITGWNNSTGVGEWDKTNNIKKTVTVVEKPTTDNKYLDKVTVTIDTNTFYPVANTNYALTDQFAQIKGTDNTWSTYDGTIAGKTDNDGKLNLMYNETAKFTGQFKKGSTMHIVQENALKTPTVRNESQIVEFGDSSRTVGNYYTTTVTLTGSSDNAPNNDNQFSYDSSTTSSSNVHITETFTNTVKTGDLTIIKNVAKGDTSEAGTFNFKVTLNTLFGSTTSVSDYSEITYKLYENKNGNSYKDNTLSADGTFTMGPNQKVVIEGIPVGTTYTVTETNTGDNYNQLSVDINGTTVTDTNQVFTIGSNNTVTVTNERKTGSLTLNKDVKDSNGTDTNVTDDDKAKEFKFTVKLTAPTGVDLSKYNIVGGTVSGDNKTITVNVSESSPVTITGIPYGTGYTVTETEVTGWTQDQDSSTGTSGTISNATPSPTATIVNKKKVALTTDAYLTITKYIDSLYYNSSDNPHGFADGSSIISGNDTTNDPHGYLKYTNAEQVFTFEVKEYDSDTLVGTYQVLLKFPANSTRLETAVNGSYYYVQSKTFKVTAGHKYEITETNTGNGLSWRYDFVEATGVFGSSNSTITNVNDSLTFTYAESAENAQNATATFYDKRTVKTTSDGKQIESDMSSITNNIKVA